MPVCITLKTLKSGLDLAECCLWFGLLGFLMPSLAAADQGPQEAHAETEASGG